MFKNASYPLCLTICLLMLCACKPQPEASPSRGMYCWSTSLEIDSTKQAFLQAHNIGRLYVRYFDVTLNDRAEPIPNATIDLKNAPNPSALKVEIVPVVFLLNDCFLPQAKTDEDRLAQQVLDRVLQMNSTHRLGKVTEIQLDCDWTGTSRKRFFKFLQAMKKLTEPKGITLSSTIRLHQLSQTPPPVDRGILMVYNTGDMTDIKEEHPILDIRVVQKYAPHLKNYDLPLGSAYPIYKWDLLFRNGKFVDIQHYEGELPVIPGDQLLSRQPTAQEILQARKILEGVRPDINSEIILFDLNNYNLNRFSHEDFESFFN